MNRMEFQLQTKEDLGTEFNATDFDKELIETDFIDL